MLNIMSKENKNIKLRSKVVSYMQGLHETLKTVLHGYKVEGDLSMFTQRVRNDGVASFTSHQFLLWFPFNFL